HWGACRARRPSWARRSLRCDLFLFAGNESQCQDDGEQAAAMMDSVREGHRNTAVYNLAVALATKSPIRLTSPRSSLGDRNGAWHCEVVQSDEGLRIYPAPGRRQRCICPHLRGRARWTERAQRGAAARV